MLPVMGSKSHTVAMASSLSITSPSMCAGDPGLLPGSHSLATSVFPREPGATERGSVEGARGERAVRWLKSSPPECEHH